jgi:hypothetical protein
MRGLLITCALVSVVLSGCASSSGGTPPSTYATPPALLTLPPVSTTAPPTTTTTEPADVAPPSITTSPANGETVRWFRGDLLVATDPGSVLTIDGERVELATDGTYALPIMNNPGANVFDVTSSDTAGNVATIHLRYEFDPEEGWIAAIGDSVMLGSKEEIEKRLGEGIVDATVSRQFLDAPKLVNELLGRTVAPQVIIVGLGTNGPVQERHFDEVMEIAGTEPLVAFINVHVPRKWETTSNDQLSAGVTRYTNAVLVDWYAATDGRDDLFAGDGFHPRQPGRVIMADLLVATIFPDRESVPSEAANHQG